jgi:hypothetical protein
VERGAFANGGGLEGAIPPRNPEYTRPGDKFQRSGGDGEPGALRPRRDPACFRNPRAGTALQNPYLPANSNRVASAAWRSTNRVFHWLTSKPSWNFFVTSQVMLPQ